jgi:hypothetical protein
VSRSEPSPKCASQSFGTERQRGEKLQGGSPISRETGCVQGREYPEAPAARSACGRAEKAREGMKERDERSSLPRARSLEAGKPKGAFAAAIRLIPGPAEVLRLVCETLEGRPPLVMSGGETPRAVASEKTYSTRRGAKPRRVEPHERNRDGTSPGGHEGSKASRGCETLRTQRNRRDGSRWG